MRILFVTHQYLQKGKPEAGTPHYLHRLSLALIAEGHIPMIITGGQEDGHMVEDGIEIWTVKTVIKYPKIFKGENFYHIKRGYQINRKIKEILKGYKVDIIQFSSVGGFAIFYYGQVPAVMRLASYAKTYFSTKQTYSARTLFFKAELERLSSRRCTAVFAPCRVTAEAFGRDCRRNVKVIETPFVNDVKKMDYEYVENYLNGKKYVLFFGTFYPEKGILIIIDILKKFLERNNDYFFVFVGETRMIKGVDARNLIRRAAGEFFNRVFIWDAISHEKLFPIIRYADFVVMPSLMDNFPNACIEAMHFSKIVIGTDGASFEQLIRSGYNGYLCRIGDSEDLLEKMEIVTQLEPENKHEIEKNAHKTTIRLHPKYTVKKLLQFYDFVLRERK